MKPAPDRPLPSLADQPASIPWPTEQWTEADPAQHGASADLGPLLDELVADDPHPDFGRTYGAAVVVGATLVAERYGQRVVQDLRAMGENPPHEPVTAYTELLSWSMAKSITSLAVGVAVRDGALSIDEPVGDPIWLQAPDDPRAAITWADLLTMRPGLAWTEQYYDLDPDAYPDVVTMLYGSGAADMARFAADKALVTTPGSPEAYVYSSGTTNIIAGNLQRVLGLDQAGMDRFLHERIFDPIGMSSARASFDQAGTYVGSSYTHATLRDWCRFGLLAARGGAWDGNRIVPVGWLDWSRTARSWEEELLHGAQWWTWDLPEMPFGAHGFEGQRVVVFPRRDVVVARFGKMGADDGPALNTHLAKIAACFPELP